MCQDKTARIIIKQSSGVPTIPVSADHRNGDWLSTDIYEGEQYQDTDTGIVYTRSSTGIEAVGGGGGAIQPRVYKAQISQSGTSAPTLTTLRDDFGLTLTPSYDGVGDYSITGFDSNLTGLIETNLTGLVKPSELAVFILTSSSIRITTAVSAVLTNGLLNNTTTALGSSVLTIIKYD